MTNVPADLVARLREDADCAPGRLHQSLEDAANEIERLERERAEWASVAATRNLNIVLIAEEKDAEQLKRRQAEHERDSILEGMARLGVLLVEAIGRLRAHATTADVRWIEVVEREFHVVSESSGTRG